jgi:hypothetical protein
VGSGCVLRRQRRRHQRHSSSIDSCSPCCQGTPLATKTRLSPGLLCIARQFEVEVVSCGTVAAWIERLFGALAMA